MALSTIQNNSFADTAVHGYRNLIINGAMQIYQRGAGTLASGQFGPDRFQWGSANLDNLAGTLTQDSDAPDNFGSSLKVTVTTAETAIASDEYAYLHQRIEAQNLQGLGYGTSSAKQVTLSFWVKSSVTGTFAVGLYKGDNTGQIHNKTYTINSAGTWEYKTVTFAANTLAGGAIDNDNGIGLYLNWHLAAGSDFKGTSSSSGWISYVVSSWADGQDTDAVITTTNATWYLTGVQLEVGDVATPFEHRLFGDELARCQRYYEKSFDYNTAPVQNVGSVSGSLTVSGVSTTANVLLGHVNFAVVKRAVPAIYRYNPFYAGTGWSQAGVFDLNSGTYGIGTNGFSMRVESAPTLANTNLLIHWVADSEL